MTLEDQVATLDALVGFRSVSTAPNLPLLEWVEDRLLRSGIRSQRLPGPPGKASLVATIGPPAAGGVVLCAHTDVVPADAEQWTFDPFRATVSGDKVYGRGTADMKGFLACVLEAMPAFAARPLSRPVTIALTYDEEIGCLAAPELGAYLRNELPEPAAVIVGEPTCMRIVRSHKGVRVLRTTVTGEPAHASKPAAGVSAINRAAGLIIGLESLAARVANEERPHPAFDPPHSTVNVGVVRGGQAPNIVAGSCSFDWEIRTVPGRDSDVLMRSVRELEGAAPATTVRAEVDTQTLADVPALDDADNARAAELLQELGLAPAPDGVAFGTDGAALARAGLPTVVCGPGSMEQGHRPDEFIETAQLEHCGRFLERLAAWAATP
ncbi:MAG: acetylornithine deacetylase [Actinomycetota bacterium]|jgi:acetylornithine deacetylase|nr:acetylornithine deacetylase [Actinomycetota bacterium]